MKAPVGLLSDRTVSPQARWRGLAPTSSAHDAQDADNARKKHGFPAGVQKCAKVCKHPEKGKSNEKSYDSSWDFCVLEGTRIPGPLIKRALSRGTLIFELSSLRRFCAKHRDFSRCNFCALCRILQVRVPIAFLETVQKQCRNRALTLGQIKNDDFCSMTWWRFE